jgi:ribonuclease D
VSAGAPLPDDDVDAADLPVLREPHDGVPTPIASPEALADFVARVSRGSGPVALDAERASGYRYSQRAYLVQLRRAGVGSALIDPIACPNLSELGRALQDAEWILHAASQDLPCLAELGMHPQRLFDTELAGRLLGHPRVALASMTERVLGVSLEKGHGAADWSTRPLPHDWLVYAALDVELLIELREALIKELNGAGKLAWAEQEFAALAAAPPAPPRVDPWRRTSGIHRVRTRPQLAALRGLWSARDELAQRRDIAPGRVLRDKAMIDIVLAAPASAEALRRLPSVAGRSAGQQAGRWWSALHKANELPESELPETSLSTTAPPPTNRWAGKDATAATRLARVRAALNKISEKFNVPTENLVPPDAVRRIAWQPPASSDAEAVRGYLADRGARPWQIELVTTALCQALPDPPPTS